MKKTTIEIPKMDCPSEMKMIENLFERVDEKIKLDFNLSDRTVIFYHNLNNDRILGALSDISLPGKLVDSSEIFEGDVPDISPNVEAKTLKILLGINFTMFVVEVLLGIYAESTGLFADGLDMLADSFVYGLSLYAVGKALSKKNRAAYLSGIMQISLGLVCLIEVARKFYFGSSPMSDLMIGISILALIANIYCLALLYKHKSGEVHMKASWIFSANDVIVNLGVLVSGALVYYFKSNIPDLAIGAVVAIIVIRGGASIIKLSKIDKNLRNNSSDCCKSDCN